MSDGLDLLALGAHPDDVEVHVGGILALATERGLRAAILDLTSGDLGIDSFLDPISQCRFHSLGELAIHTGNRCLDFLQVFQRPIHHIDDV